MIEGIVPHSLGGALRKPGSQVRIGASHRLRRFGWQYEAHLFGAEELAEGGRDFGYIEAAEEVVAGVNPKTSGADGDGQ